MHIYIPGSNLLFAVEFFKSLSYLYEVVLTIFSADFFEFSQFLTSISRNLWRHLAMNMRIMYCR